MENPTKEYEAISNIEPVSPFSALKKDFNPKCFPRRIRRICDHLHELNDTPEEMLYFCATGIVAGIAGDRFQATKTTNKNYRQYPNQYIVGIGDSSVGKSTALNPLMEVIWRKESEVHKAYIANKTNGAIDARIVIENATSEAIAIRQQICASPLFSVSAEAGQILDIIGGAYKKRGNDGISYYNKAWSGETYSCDRVNRENVYIDRAMLSALWLTQSAPFEKFLSNSEAYSTGLIARFLCFNVESKPQYDDGIEKPKDESIFHDWENFIGRLYDERSSNDVKTIRATDKARDVFRLFHNSLEDFKGRLGDLYRLIAKSREKAIRLALAFAICDESDIIDEQTARNACEVVEYCNGVLLGYYESKYFNQLENIKRKMEEVFLQCQQDRLMAAIFKQRRRLSMEDLEKGAKAYPKLFEIKDGDTNGKAVLYLGNLN